MTDQLEQFRKRLNDSGLVSEPDLQSLIDGLPTNKQPTDATQLARELVRCASLTAFQAQQIYAGRGKSLVLGNYVVLDKIGQGGMGMVLKAEHRRMKRLVAIKLLARSLMKDRGAVQRFHREVEAAARLEHPNVVTAYDADEANGTHFLVMQYVDGIDLGEFVKRNGPLPLEQALPCVQQAAQGLAYAHEQGIVHRDVKPSNLLLDAAGTVKILDLGLARLEAASTELDQLTGSGQIMGTVDYMAPEQAVDSKNVDTRADIYSLGATLWFLLTGRPIHDGQTTIEKLMAHQSQPTPSLQTACPEVPDELESVFMRMVAKDRDTRFPNMKEVIAGLQRCAVNATPPLMIRNSRGGDSRLSDLLTGGEADSTTSIRSTNTRRKPTLVAALEPTMTIQSAHVKTDTKAPPSVGDFLATLSSQAANKFANGRRGDARHWLKALVGSRLGLAGVAWAAVISVLLAIVLFFAASYVDESREDPDPTERDVSAARATDAREAGDVQLDDPFFEGADANSDGTQTGNSKAIQDDPFFQDS